MPEDAFIDIPPLDDADITEIISSWLENDDRNLQDEQRKILEVKKNPRGSRQVIVAMSYKHDKQGMAITFNGHFINLKAFEIFCTEKYNYHIAFQGLIIALHGHYHNLSLTSIETKQQFQSDKILVKMLGFYWLFVGFS